MGRIREAQATLLDEEQVQATLDRLVAEQRMPLSVATELRHTLRETQQDLTYVLGHAGVCVSVIGIRAALPFVLVPIGSMIRTSWVGGWRLIETVRGRTKRARVHSLRVFCIAAVPFVGYFAYLLPLRSFHPAAAYLYANHVTMLRYGQLLEETLSTRPRFFRGLISLVVARPEWRAPDAKP